VTILGLERETVATAEAAPAPFARRRDARERLSARLRGVGARVWAPLLAAAVALTVLSLLPGSGAPR